MKINIYGNVWGSSGYSVHCRGLARALSKIADVAIETALPNGWQQQCDDWIRPLIEKNYRTEATLMITQPQHWLYKLADRPKKTVGYLVFEGSRVPEHWIEIAGKVDQYIVPSSHVAQAVMNTVDVPEPNIIAHGIDPTVYNAENKQYGKNEKFTFLFVGGWAQGKNDRKDLSLLLRAFSEEFKPEEKVQLKCKINAAYLQPGVKIMDQVNQIGLKPESERPTMFFTTETLTDKEMAKIYTEADVFVCPSRAEGFGLPFLEAMACGTPCISPNYGGQLDFITPGNSWIVHSGKFIPSGDIEPWYRGVQWWDMDQADLQRIMRHAFENRDLVEERGRAAALVAQSYTWDHTAKKILRIFERLS